jgi:hypothetical protein
MIWEMENWAFQDLPEVQDGDSFVQCNIVRFEMNTNIFEGKTGLSFLDCNLINCVLPGDSQVDGCNTAINEYEMVEEV